jgi:DNA repair protein RadC
LQAQPADRTQRQQQPMAPTLTVQFMALEHEVFRAAFLDAQHRLLALRSRFRDTLRPPAVNARKV